MLSSEELPGMLHRAALVARRFQKFVLVGAMGLGINQGALFLLVGVAGRPVIAASPVAIILSMIATFVLNEQWTWRDRGEGRIFRRAAMYGTINTGGLLINWLLLVVLDRGGLNYLLANLIGAGVAAIWNFGLNHSFTWRK